MEDLGEVQNECARWAGEPMSFSAEQAEKLKRRAAVELARRRVFSSRRGSQLADWRAAFDFCSLGRPTQDDRIPPATC